MFRFPVVPLCGIKFHLKSKLPQAICCHNKKPRMKTCVASMLAQDAVPTGSEMPEIKVMTDIAGRVCALPAEIGGRIGTGDDIVVVEAMKMEIPVPAPAAGTLKTLLVKLDDVVAEGQVVAILSG
jgi:biotin carboxyl carrier protein